MELCDVLSGKHTMREMDNHEKIPKWTRGDLAIAFADQRYSKWVTKSYHHWHDELFDAVVPTQENYALLRKRGVPWGNNNSLTTKVTGVDMLQWLRSQGCPWTYRACVAAIARGDMESARWIRKERHAIAPAHHSCIAHAKDCDTIEWLVTREECPVDPRTMNCAIRQGNALAVRWLLDHHCKMDYHVRHLASKHPHIEAMIFV